MKYEKTKLAGVLIAVVVIGLFAIRIYNSHRYHLEKQTRFMMDTYVTINAVGPEMGLELVERMTGMETIMITTKGETPYSSGLKDPLQHISKLKTSGSKPADLVSCDPTSLPGAHSRPENQIC